MSILVLNAGSSTLKFALFDDAARDELGSGVVDWRGESSAALTFRYPDQVNQLSSDSVVSYGDAVGWILRSLADAGFADQIGVVGHRIVHGGTEFRDATQIDERVRQSLRRIAELAPLHNPPALTTIDAARSALPDAAQIAAFDTAFFATLPRRAFVYPVPYEWYERFGIRRFGFHGLSHAYCANRAAEMLDRRDDSAQRLVVCHLGNGCSATAIRNGDPLATSMGFTPLEGLMMGSRSGSIDPGILIHLLQQGLDADQLDRDLNRHSGLLGVSGISADFRQVEEAANAGNERAQLAMEIFIDRIRSMIGSLAVTLGGIDALVFTAGIGENSSTMRHKVTAGLECLGLDLDADKNQNGRPDCDVATPQSAGRILVIRTREERMIAREVRRLHKL